MFLTTKQNEPDSKAQTRKHNMKRMLLPSSSIKYILKQKENTRCTLT